MCFLRVTKAIGIGIGTLAISSYAQGAPLVDSLAGVSELESRYIATVFRDSDDPNLFYLPYSRLQIVPSSWNQSIPAFSFSYSPDGALLSFTVKPSLDRERLESVVNSIRRDNPNARFKPLPIEGGRYVPTLRTESLIDELLVDKSKGVGIEQNQPHLETSFSFFFERDVADRIVMALNTGAAFGLNYSYRFRAMTTPSAALVRVNWGRLESRVSRYSGMGSAISRSAIEKSLVSDGQQGLVEVKLLGGGDSSLLPMIYRKVTRLITDKCFVGIESGSATGDESPVSLAGYRSNPAGCGEQPDEFEIVTQENEEFTAQAGLQIGGLCTRYKSHFNFVGAEGRIETGCPNTIYGTSTPVSAITEDIPLRHPEVPDPSFLFSLLQ